MRASSSALTRADAPASEGVRRELLRDENVHFAGYQMPHPLVHELKLRIADRIEVLANPDGSSRVLATA